MLPKAFVALGFFAIALASGACGATGSQTTDPESSVYQRVTDPSFSPGATIPAPVGEVILTITGEGVATNVGDALQFDIATLERLGLVEYTVEDPWLKEGVTYTGVLMSELSKYIRSGTLINGFHITALDDYEVDLSSEDIQRWPILLATRSNGEYMNVKNSGPTRVIFPYHSYSEIDPVKYDDLWIWNIESMQVD